MWWSLKDAEGKRLTGGSISSAHYTPPSRDSGRSWGSITCSWNTYPKADIVYTSSDVGCFSSSWLYLRAEYCQRIWGSVSRLIKNHPNAYLTISFGGDNHGKHVKLSDFQSIAKSFKLLHLREKLIGGHIGIGVGSGLALGSLIAVATLLSMGTPYGGEGLFLAGAIFLMGTAIIFAGLCGSGYSKNLKAADALNTESKSGNWTFFAKEKIEEQFLAAAPKAVSDQ